MRIAYTTTFDAQQINHWSGTPYHMARAFIADDIPIEYIGNIKRKLPKLFKLKQTYHKIVKHQRMSPRFNVFAARHYSEQIAKRLNQSNVDVILSPLVNPIAYLETSVPIVLWTDAVYSSLLGFYPSFNYHSAETIREANAMTFSCLSRVSLAIFSSDWAAQSAIQLYGINREKIHVVPFGANIETYPAQHEINEIIQKRSLQTIRLLFLAKSWERKGGDIAIAIAKALHETGTKVELNIVGYTPNIHFPPYIHCLGFISKHTEEGKKQLQKLLTESHFLLLPSRADACPMVLAEANAHALPCLTTHIGGIPTAIKNDVNGKTFGLDDPIDKYVNYILTLIQDKKRYFELARSSHHEYESRLNWKTSIRQVKNLIQQL